MSRTAFLTSSCSIFLKSAIALPICIIPEIFPITPDGNGTVQISAKVRNAQLAESRKSLLMRMTETVTLTNTNYGQIRHYRSQKRKAQTVISPMVSHLYHINIVIDRKLFLSIFLQISREEKRKFHILRD